MESFQIDEFTFSPVPKLRDARLRLLACMFTALFFIIGSIIIPKFKGIVSLVAVVFLAFVIYIFVRYIACRYSYIIMQRQDGGYSFLVTKVIGKRVETMAAYELSEIASINKIENKKQVKSAQSEKKYNFLASMKPCNIYAVRVKTRYEGAVMLLEIPEDVANVIASAVSIAKATEPEE